MAAVERMGDTIRSRPRFTAFAWRRQARSDRGRARIVGSHFARLELVLAQIAELERERDEVAAAEAPDRAGKMIQQLTSLRGIGVQSATVLVREAFVRHFSNGKALGSYAGALSRQR